MKFKSCFLDILMLILQNLNKIGTLKVVYFMSFDFCVLKSFSVSKLELIVTLLLFGDVLHKLGKPMQAKQFWCFILVNKMYSSHNPGCPLQPYEFTIVLMQIWCTSSAKQCTLCYLKFRLYCI